MMKSLLDTLQFLTTIPLRRVQADERLNVRLEFFPLVGILAGLVLATAGAALSVVFPPFVTGASVIVLLVFITGGLHLDGLADTADGFGSSRPREEILRIMRDSRTGAMGVIAVACVLALKIAAASSLAPQTRTQALLLMPVAGRCGMAVLMGYMPLARNEGLAAAVRPARATRQMIWSGAALLIIGWLAWGMNGVLVGLASLVALAPLSLLMLRKIGGITGDTLGATCEVVETVSLVIAAGIGFGSG
ncbi:MAG: adenosylcobinamide-GDP ribazoletransferase [Candidatus Abyssobacteria bacterium SURF_5]|jgi:adenosylcobinamide-GDP ribazoletransferase|uniref:Adenosylcobinamide-GDP ribazoletransferase n=1 Tax=Abyssobacteria bacterium (strain SURF_5) TaxID=2093360 RepID=A0A3A4NW03_ABYX5|nr:MAG: adenosylcobinamide-GDP ribazoletransferase [Candidatus Abyssubacteria bacterium SURF_5]